MNVADQLQQIGVFLAQNRFVASLKQMADLFVSAVVILGVALLEPLHEFAKGGAGALQEQMNVIGHQAVRIDGHPVFTPVLRKFSQIRLIVGGFEKRLLSLVAANDDVIQNAGGK